MEDQDTEQAASLSTPPERAQQVAQSEGREDDRNEEVADSPVPDPTRGDTHAGDIPEAD